MTARTIESLAAEAGIHDVSAPALSKFAALVLAAGFPAFGELRIVSVHVASTGKRVGLRLSCGPDMCVVFDDQERMPGIRAGEFVPNYGDTLMMRAVR